MAIQYTLIDPTKNYTILCSTPVPIYDQPDVAAALMDQEPFCEQVGFLLLANDIEDENADISLRMAGGEFCGNATMSTAAYYVARTTSARKIQDITHTVMVDASGADGLTKVQIRQLAEDTYEGTVRMPKPLGIETCELEYLDRTYNLTLVRFKGISHLISEEPIPKRIAEKAIQIWCEQLKTDGLGLMLVDRAENRLTPLVYVPGSDTLFWENSCASGTSAVGYYMAHNYHSSIKMGFHEPGGMLEVQASPDGEILLKGQVTLLHDGALKV